MNDHKSAVELAEQAGRLLLELRAVKGFDDPDGLRDAGDQSAHRFLTTELAKRCPNDAICSEHDTTDIRRGSAERVWIVDPLDGTREFGEAGRTDWAVHVALWECGQLTAGAVALPARSQVLSTSPRPQLGARHDGPLRIAVSRTRAPETVNRVAEVLGGRLVPMGSAGVKITSVITGETDAYVHAGGQYEWDSAAPVAVARAAGLHTSRIDGSELVYNQPDPWLPDLLVCRPELADSLLNVIDAKGVRD